VSYGHCVKQMKLAEEQIAELLQKAEDADSTPLQDGLSIPAEIARREARLAKLREAKQAMEERAKERLIAEREDYEAKLAERLAKEQATGKKPKGRSPEPPQEGPKRKDQYNFTDPESRIMKSGKSFEQCYNAQAAVDTETMLIVGQHVTDQANDKQQLNPTLATVSPAAGPVGKVLVDSGYYSQEAVIEAESGSAGDGQGPKVYAAMKRQRHGRGVADLEQRVDPPAPPPDAGVKERMGHLLDTEEGRRIYGLRKQTVEPVFGIIKEALGFRRFLLRGSGKVELEWSLVTTSYNLKRLFSLGMKVSGA
jgi:hypothetical protein